MAAEVDLPIAAVRVAPAAEAITAAPAALVEAVVAPPAAAEPAVAAVVPVAEAVVEPAKIELVGERPSLLENVGKDAKPAAADKPAAPEPAKDAAKPSEKPAEAAKPVEAKPDPAKPAEAAKPVEAAAPEALAAIDYKYTVPDTLKMDDGLKAEVHSALDAFRANPAEGAQGLIDLHDRTMASYATNLQAETLRNQHKAFNDTRDGWNKDWAADEQIGGSGYQTSLRAIARMRDQFVSAELPGTPKYQADLKSFEEFLRVTGAGDHPAFGRFLHNVAHAFDEPPLPPHNPQPTKGNGQRPGSRRERMYDHPSSSKTS